MVDLMNGLLSFALFFGACVAAMQLRDEPEIARRAHSASTKRED